jgi:hypothetical protein
LKIVIVVVFLVVSASFGGAATVTVGPSGQYPSPCAAFQHLADGDTVQVDANHGVPYNEGNCHIVNHDLKIIGINGRPILDASGIVVARGIWEVLGHDIVIDNFEFRNANKFTNLNTSYNASGIRIRSGQKGPDGGDITVRHCSIHDNGDGVLVDNAGPGMGQWFSSSPEILFEYDDLYKNGDESGPSHNIYVGWGGNLTFTFRYSKSRDAYLGHDIKTRARYNNILYNQITDNVGATSYLLNFPVGGTTYVVGNLLSKVAVTNPVANGDLMLYRDVGDTDQIGAAYGPPNEDLHFLNNVVIDNSPSRSNSFVTVSCPMSSSGSCQAPVAGPRLTKAAEIKNNLFVGRPTHVTNQPGADVQFNVILPYTAQDAVWINRALASMWNGEK